MKLLSKSSLQKFLSLHANSVFYRMTLAFALFFIGPLLGLLFLGLKTDLLGSQDLMYYLLGMLVVSLGGYVILKQIAEGIVAIEAKMSGKERGRELTSQAGESELKNISLLADAMRQNIQQTSESLTKRMLEIQAIKDINTLAASRLKPQSLISLAVDKALDITGAGGAAVFIAARGEGPSSVACVYCAGDGFASTSVQFALSGFVGKKAFDDNKPLFLHESFTNWQELFSENCRMAAAVPLTYHNGQQAVVILTQCTDKPWDESVLNFLATFFNATSSCLRMQELGTKEKETGRELQAILAILQIINSDIQENDLLAAVADKVYEVLPHQWLGIALLDQTTNELRLIRTFRKFVSGIPEEIILEKKSSLFQRPIDVMERVDCDNLVAEGSFFESDMFTKLGLQSCMVDSLHANGKIIGSICLGAEKPYVYGPHEKKVFSQLVTGIALALEQTRILSKERAKSTELEILNRIGIALTSSAFDIRRVLHYIIDMVVNLINVEAGTIMLLDHDALIFHAATGIAGKNLEGAQVRLGQGICGWVAATGESVVIQDVKESPHFFAGIDDKTGFKTRSLACVPMISNGRVVGVVQLINKMGSFTEEDLQSIKSVASSTAIALENTRLHTESRQLAEKERLIRTVFQKYVPEEVINSILEKGDQDHTAHGERKIITVFNVDIRGYSEMSKLAATEDVVGVLNYFYMKMGNIILRHKGVLDKYLGDGFLAIFGAPVATRNPALDAAFAAIEMVKMLDEVSKVSMERCGIPLKIGISLNTGEAIVGNIGFERKMEYTAIGDVVNETFRLQELTREKSDLILMSDSTYLQVKSFILANPWGVRTIDDKGGKMKIYEVVDRKEISDIGGTMNVMQDMERNALKIH